MVFSCTAIGAMWMVPVTLRPDRARSGTIFASTGAATKVKTTGMSVTCLRGSASPRGPTSARVCGVPQL